MSNEQVNLIGYHGTKSECAKSIKKEGFKIRQKVGWLGKGVYFYEKNKEIARCWAKKRYKGVRVEVLHRNIFCEIEKTFDIVDPNSKDSEYFFRQREIFIKTVGKEMIKAKFDSKERFEGKILDIICGENGYKVTRACTYTYQEYDEIYGTNSIFANGVEICVKDLDCIS